ncbi:protein SODIUM POTASSIUM ROOT DEFECTIVE 1 [Nicotiana tomentosiformis]|uniref:protein SODIUM POTASSIUM ROOT DEFECTIVE 1 n=1 Tax=Nicotiana tomentosiformis TaxID=4098 RepID=UPI00051BB09B|nr:protein SODIUM POTASSIUM ROOT DEFECTIVE 2 [Nicotiana tomentosiformis]
MKSIELFCASPASTAICSSMDQRTMVRRGIRHLDHKIDRLGDRSKIKTPVVPCSSSQLPFDPKNYYQKGRKSSSKPSELRRKSSADITDLANSSPPSYSSRYLLSDTPFIDFLSSDHSSGDVHALVPSKSLRAKSTNERLMYRSSSTRSIESPVYKPSPVYSKDLCVYKSSSTRSCAREQVVELMVSIHCKGCEGKVRKHISRMEGVKSFKIDFPSKKVTIIGDVTPLGVLASISKVKNAQFWPSPTTSSSSYSSSSSPMV